MKRRVFRAALVGASVLAAVLELWAALDGSPDTEPLTWLIVNNVSPEWTAAGIAALTVWLWVHFHRAYQRRTRPGQED